MNRLKIIISVLVISLVCVAVVMVVMRKRAGTSDLSVRYPFDKALFPPEFPAPGFEWQSAAREAASERDDDRCQNQKHNGCFFHGGLSICMNSNVRWNR